MIDNCPECAELAQKMIAALQEPKTDKKKKRNVQKAPDELNALAGNINAIYAKPLGTYTVRTLTTLKWITTEIARINEDTNEDSNIGRDFLSEMKADIDRFIFDREAPNFVNFQAQKSMDLFREFSSFAKTEGDRLMMQIIGTGQGKWVDMSRMTETDVIKTVAAFQDGVRSAGNSSLAARIQQYTQKSVELFDRTRLAAGVNETYCTFFQRAGVYTSNMQYACEGMAANAVRRNLRRQTNNDFVTQPVLPTVPAEAVTDWVESLTKVIQHINQNPDRYKKKNDITPR